MREKKQLRSVPFGPNMESKTNPAADVAEPRLAPDFFGDDEMQHLVRQRGLLSAWDAGEMIDVSSLTLSGLCGFPETSSAGGEQGASSHDMLGDAATAASQSAAADGKGRVVHLDEEDSSTDAVEEACHFENEEKSRVQVGRRGSRAPNSKQKRALTSAQPAAECADFMAGRAGQVANRGLHVRLAREARQQVIISSGSVCARASTLWCTC